MEVEEETGRREKRMKYRETELEMTGKREEEKENEK